MEGGIIPQQQRKRRAVTYADDEQAGLTFGAPAGWGTAPNRLAEGEFMLPDDLDLLLDSFDYEGVTQGLDVGASAGGFRPDAFAQVQQQPEGEQQHDEAHSRENSGSGPTDTMQSAESGFDLSAQVRENGEVANLRCIDDAHPADCTRCFPAPPAELEGAYELVGDPGKKNGEKRLRHLLTRTPEWKSTEERERLADMCNRDPALAPLAAALHAKSCSALRKGHLLFMVRAWGYKSDLWVPRGSRGKAGAAVAPAQQAMLPAAQAQQQQQQQNHQQQQQQSSMQRSVATLETFKSASNSSAIVEAEKLSDYVNSRLKPLALEAARCNVGSAASEAAWLHGGQHITEAAANEVHKVVELTRAYSEQWRLHKQCVQGRLESLADSPEEANAPAYLTCMGKESPTERLIFQILTYMQQAAHFNSSIPRQLGETITPAELAWVNEVAKGQKQAMELLARVLAIIAEARLASLHICLQAFVQLLDVLAMWTASSSASFAQREAWMRSYMSVHGSGSGPLLIFKGPDVKDAVPPQLQQGCPSHLQSVVAVEAEVRKLAAH